MHFDFWNYEIAFIISHDLSSSYFMSATDLSHKNRLWHLHCQTLGNRCECHGSSEMTIYYKQMPCVTVGVACLRTLSAQWPWGPSIGQNLQPFTGYIMVNFPCKWKRWTTNTQTNDIRYHNTVFLSCTLVYLVWSVLT